MKKGISVKFFIILACVLFLSACISSAPVESPPVTTMPVPTPGPTVSPVVTDSPSPQPTETPAATETPVEPDKEPPAVDPDEKVPDSEYGGYDNTLRGWWYRKSPGTVASVPEDISSMLERFRGIYRHETQEKVLYLTFDEGYEFGYTPLILDTLRDNNVKAAFFITWGFLRDNRGLVSRMLEEGHIVANHSVNHPSLPGKNDKEVIEEILGLERRYYEAFGRNMKYFRAPMGEYSERVLAITWDLGYHSVFWSFAYRDWETDNQKGADHAYNEIMPYLHNGCVLLLHAVSQDNAQALDRVIRDAKAQGYVFKTLDDLVGSVYQP